MNFLLAVSLNITEKVFLTLACAGTLILFIQIVLILIGIDNDDIDISFDDGDTFVFLSIKNICAFFAIGGFVAFGVALSNAHLAWVIISFILSGSFAWFVVGLILTKVYKMQSNGVIDIKNAIGKKAKVYLKIPPKGQGYGKINLNLQDRYIELNAVNNTTKEISTNEFVKIIDVIEDTLVVEKI